MSGEGIRVFLLGGFRVERGAEITAGNQGRGRPARQLFKWLLTRRIRRLQSDEVFEAFWPDSDPETSSALRGAIHHLRRMLESDVTPRDSVIEFDDRTISVRGDADLWVDADAFERLLSEAGRTDDPIDLLEEADALYVGDYLPDDLYDDWATQRRDALRNLWSELQFNLSRGREQRDDVPGAILALQLLLEKDRCDERAARELMLLLTRHGRRSEALRVYQRLLDALRDELDAEPDPETVAVHQQVTTWAAGASVAVTSQEAPVRPGGAASGLQPAPPEPPPLPFQPTYPFPEPDTLVGRAAELNVLVRSLERGREGGQVVMLGAPAGSGKSTLVGVLVREATSAGYLCLAGGSYDSESPLPFGPVRDALVDYLLSQPADRLRATLAEVLTDLADVVPELRYHLAIPESPAGTRDASRLYGAVHAFLRSLAAARPVLLCLEDLHAADGATIALIHYLARQTRRLPLVLICTYRSDEAPPPLTRVLVGLTRERLADMVALAPFDEEETSQLIASLLDGPFDPGLRDSLHAVTEGNPLFVDQLVRALVEGGLVRQQDGVWNFREGAGPVVPPLIRDVIGQRFERVGLRCREMLALAAVFGQTFDFRLLAAALGDVAEQQVMVDLDAAVAAQLIQENAGRYRFVHAMVREVLYNGLGDSRRALFHEHAGLALERLAGDRAGERAAELANHFLLARESPTARGKALIYSLEAGRHAASVSAHREARRHFETAQELAARDQYAEPSARLDALAGRAQAMLRLGDWTDSVAEWRAFLDRCDDPVRRAQARVSLSRALSQLGDSLGVLAEIEIGLAECAGLEDERTREPCHWLRYNQAFIWYLQGKYRAVQGLGEAMLGDAEQIGAPDAIGAAHSVVAWSYMGRGMADDAIRAYEQAQAAAIRAGDKNMMAIAEDNLGIQNYRAARFAAARLHLDRAVELYRQMAHEIRAVNSIQTLGRILLAEGDLDGAAEQAEIARSATMRGQDRWLADCLDLIGGIQIMRGEWTAAARGFEQALEVRERVGHLAGIVKSLLGMGLAAEHGGEPARAEQLYRRAVSTAELMDPGPQRLAAYRRLGRLLLRQGNPESSVSLASALALADEIPESIEVAPTLVAAGEAQLADRPAEALVLLDRGLAARPTADVAIEAHALAAQAAMALGRSADGRRHAQTSVRLAQRMGSPWLIALAERASARTEAMRG